jgi:Cys-tRNA(Pro) deacylase
VRETILRFRTQTIPGKGRGKHLGFPTLNLRIPPELDLAHGIYACWVRVGEATYPGALHYGPVPAFGEDAPSLEVHVVDATLEARPPEVEVEVVRFLRPVRSFEGPEALAAQMAEDVERARQVLAEDAGVRRVASWLAQHGIEPQILRFPEGTRTAQEAARALGTTPERIVKSLLFLADGRPVLALVSGAHRVSAPRLAEAAGARSARAADRRTVQEVTGYPAGAVPPVGLQIPVYMDEALLRHDVVYAGAGAPDALVALDPRRLRDLVGARVVRLREED